MVSTAWDAVEQTWYPKPGWRPSRWPLWLSAPLSSVGHPTTSWGSGTGSNQPLSSTHLSMCTTYCLSLATWTHAVTRSSTASTRRLFGPTSLTWWRAAVVSKPTAPRLALWIACLLEVLELLWRWSLIRAQTSTVGTPVKQWWSDSEEWSIATLYWISLMHMSAVWCSTKSTSTYMDGEQLWLFLPFTTTVSLLNVCTSLCLWWLQFLKIIGRAGLPWLLKITNLMCCNTQYSICFLSG